MTDGREGRCFRWPSLGGVACALIGLDFCPDLISFHLFPTKRQHLLERQLHASIMVLNVCVHQIAPNSQF